MSAVLFPKFCIASFTVILLCNLNNYCIAVNNYQGNPDLIYLTDDSYKHENLSRYTRQTSPMCRIPYNSFHTTYKLVGPSYAAPGDEVESFKILATSCDSGFKISPISQNHSICINGEWSPPLQICLRACPSLISTNSTNVRCRWIDYKTQTIPLPNCMNAVERTTAVLTCNSLHEEPNIEKNPIRVCREGRWDPPISECYPICGIKRPKGTANIINGTDAEPGDYPWQIGIYNAEKELICGGSILANLVILSAAHCFADYRGNVHPTDNYLVGAGKYYRKYDDERDKLAQYPKILEIHIPSRYKGVTNLQDFDIAVIVLADPLKISEAVLPVCIDVHQESQYLHLSLNRYGVVTGWGYTQGGGKPSDVLKEIIIPYISYDECFSSIPENFRQYLTHDKICGGYLNKDKGVCKGDSGGGLVFKKLNSDRYYIKGIVSVSPATEELTCDANQYSVYTSVDEHIDFIQVPLLFNQIQRKIECKEDCEEQCIGDCLTNILPSMEHRNNSTDPISGNVKINCTLPSFPQNGRYSLKNKAYRPGSYVEVNSVLSLTCKIGYTTLYRMDTAEFYCSDKGEWTPPLESCLGRSGYCYDGDGDYVKDGESSSWPLGSCGRTKCLDADTGSISFSFCAVTTPTPGCVFQDFDYTKTYPQCCPKDICSSEKDILSGFCSDENGDSIKEGESATWPLGSCGKTTCHDAKTNQIGISFCAVTTPMPGCDFQDFNYTQTYPQCCPRDIC